MKILIFSKERFLGLKQFSAKHPKWNVIQLEKSENSKLSLIKDILFGRLYRNCSITGSADHKFNEGEKWYTYKDF